MLLLEYGEAFSYVAIIVACHVEEPIRIRTKTGELLHYTVYPSTDSLTLSSQNLISNLRLSVVMGIFGNLYLFHSPSELKSNLS